MAKASEKPESAAGAVKETNKDARRWAMFCHLGGLAWLLWWIAPVVGGVVCSLVLWQIKKDEYEFVDDQGKEAVNFQISMLLYWAGAFILSLACVGLVLMPAVCVVDIGFSVYAAIKASNGEYYRYPLSLRLIK